MGRDFLGHFVTFEHVLQGPDLESVVVGHTQQFNVAGVSNATDVTAGDYHACILLQNGEVRCEGYNAMGQLTSQIESLKRQARQARRYKDLSGEIRRISRGSLIFSRKTAGIFAVLMCVMMPAMSRALASDSVETPNGAINSTP